MLHIVDFDRFVSIVVECDGRLCDVDGPKVKAKAQNDIEAKDEALRLAIAEGFIEKRENGRVRHYCRDCQ